MKRLLLPLLTALALPTAVNAGDLGSADFNYENIPKRYKTEKYEKLSKQDSFDWHCGGIVLIQDRPPKRTPCNIKFEDGRLIVDNGIGILPSQVIDWHSGWFQVQTTGWAAHTMQDITIYYRDNEGNIRPALFAATGSRESFSFYRRFLKWMGNVE